MRPRPLVLVVAALQVALPVTMLLTRWADEGSRPVSELPASLQMYSTAAAATYTGTDRSGSRRPLDVRSLPPVLRAVDTGHVVPDRLCARSADLLSVQRTGGAQPGIFRC